MSCLRESWFKYRLYKKRDTTRKLLARKRMKSVPRMKPRRGMEEEEKCLRKNIKRVVYVNIHDVGEGQWLNSKVLEVK